MIKIRLMGLAPEVKDALSKLEEVFDIVQRSESLDCRDSKYVRVYTECVPKNGK